MTGETPGEFSSKNETVDFDDPFYLHMSDNLVTTIISFNFLGTKNIRVWKSSITIALKARNKIGIIDDSEVQNKKDHVRSLW